MPTTVAHSRLSTSHTGLAASTGDFARILVGVRWSELPLEYDDTDDGREPL
jgi:hypothetical protein